MLASDDTFARPECLAFLTRYERWRWIYSYAGQPARDEPVWDDGQLHLREGYPYPDWTGLIIEEAEGGYNVLRVTTERRTDPVVSLTGFFTHIEDAGKYVIWDTGTDLRVDLGLPSITRSWRNEGLDSRVRQISLDEYVSKFELKDDPHRYFVLQAGGIQPENRLLPMTYDELDAVLLSDMPEAVTSRL